MAANKKNIKKVTVTTKNSDRPSLFRIVTLPLYMIYAFLFKIPDEGPANLVGLLRFIFFTTISVLLTNSHSFEHWVFDSLNAYKWMPSFVSHLILAIIAIVMMVNLFLSFIEIFGFSTGSYWYDPFESQISASRSGFDAIEEGLDYRDALLRTQHAHGNVEELKKTSFLTKERLVGLGTSPEVNDALELLNGEMRAMHSPDKYETLKNMFGGK